MNKQQTTLSVLFFFSGYFFITGQRKATMTINASEIQKISKHIYKV